MAALYVATGLILLLKETVMLNITEPAEYASMVQSVVKETVMLNVSKEISTTQDRGSVRCKRNGHAEQISNLANNHQGSVRCKRNGHAEQMTIF